MRKVCITGRNRTGSKMLSSALRQHPDIDGLGEIFQINPIARMRFVQSSVLGRSAAELPPQPVLRFLDRQLSGCTSKIFVVTILSHDFLWTPHTQDLVKALRTRYASV